jgi:hypothetical protein
MADIKRLESTDRGSRGAKQNARVRGLSATVPE